MADDLLFPLQREECFLVLSALASFRGQCLSFATGRSALGLGGRVDGLHPLTHLIIVLALE